jgi:arylsulfatase A-like enzyme
VWLAPLAAAVLAAAARALLIAAKDRYAAIGLTGFAARSAARHLFEGLLVCVVAAFAATVALRAARGRAGARVVAWAAGGLIAWLFVTGRIGAWDLHAATLAKLGSHAELAAAAAALAVAALLAFGDRLGAILLRAVAAASGLLVTAAAALLLARRFDSDRAGGPDGASRPNVILISLDTVRADHLGCYGYAQPTTPEIDRFFAHGSVRFEAAFAPQPWTLASHMTMLTSLHPIVHGVVAGRGLPRGVHTLAQLLSNAGWLTFGFAYDMPWMAPTYGFGRGFDRYQLDHQPAAARGPALAALLDDLGSERFFLFLHYFDAHSDWGGLPYEANAADRTAVAAPPADELAPRLRDPDGRDGTDLLWAMNKEGRKLPDDVCRALEQLYDAGLRGLDRALGRLFRDLDRRGLLANTIVILAADHGEEFQEHGKLLHTQAYDECVHVPLLFRLPRTIATREPTAFAAQRKPSASRSSDAEPASRAVAGLVGLIDVTPTILDLCGVAPSEAMQGRSLRPLLEGADDASGDAHVLLLDEDGRLALRTPRWKVITNGDRREVYDLEADPHEQHDLAADPTPPAAAAGLFRLLEEERRRAFALRAKTGISDARGVTLTESEIRMLKQLGYAVDGS